MLSNIANCTEEEQIKHLVQTINHSDHCPTAMAKHTHKVQRLYKLNKTPWQWQWSKKMGGIFLSVISASLPPGKVDLRTLPNIFRGQRENCSLVFRSCCLRTVSKMFGYYLLKPSDSSHVWGSVMIQDDNMFVLPIIGILFSKQIIDIKTIDCHLI